MCGTALPANGSSATGHRPVLFPALLVAAGFAVVGLTGCGGGSNLPQVSGTVTLAGAPLPGARVIFFPKGNHGTICTAEADTSGKYVIATGGIDGIAEGDYIVTVSPPAAAGPPGTAPAAGPMVPEKYRRKETSDVFIKVGAAGDPKFDIDLK